MPQTSPTGAPQGSGVAGLDSNDAFRERGPWSARVKSFCGFFRGLVPAPGRGGGGGEAPEHFQGGKKVFPSVTL